MSVPFELPLEPVEIEAIDPVNLIIFSKPKVGKTELCAQLPGSLIVDTEKGSKYVRARKVAVESAADVSKIGKAIFAAGNPYQFVVIDTITSLEDILLPYAEELYADSPGGTTWFEREQVPGQPAGVTRIQRYTDTHQPVPARGKLKNHDIRNLADGNGYQWLRVALEKVLNYIKTWAPYTIILAHVKDKNLTKEGAVFNTLDLDLTGKIKTIVSIKSDAIGYLYRKGNKNILSFKTTDDVACGARSKHLRNQEIVVSEINPETGEVSTYWDRIYIDALKKPAPAPQMRLHQDPANHVDNNDQAA